MVFGSHVAIQSVFGNAVLDEKDYFISFSILKSLEYVLLSLEIWCSLVTTKEL